MRRNKIYFYGLFLSVFFFIFLNFFAYATEIVIEGYVEGGLVLMPYGDWETTIDSGMVLFNDSLDQETQWVANVNEDYLVFVDDTSITGFYVTMEVVDYFYDGLDLNQDSIGAENFRLYGKYDLVGPLEITKGYNDNSYNLNIDPSSCADAVVESYHLHDDFYDSSSNYSVLFENSSKIILESSVDCFNMGYLRFDRSGLIIPAGSAVGEYTGSIVVTVIDGLP